MASTANQTIKVFVRARPMPPGEDNPDRNILNIDEQNSMISFSRERKGQADFQFSKVFGGDSTQQNVYDECSSIVIQDVIEGINCCVMAYGQTGSGKTYTMYGKGWEEGSNKPNLNNTVKDDVSVDENEIKDSEVDGVIETDPISNALPSIDEDSNLGVIPRSIADLFKVLDEKAAASKNFDYSISCQVMQIYNEKIYDLLQDKRRENPLQLRDARKGDDSSTVCVRGMSVFRIYSKEEAFQLLRKGLRNRAVRATDFNSESSRSHTILQLFVTIEEEDSQGLQMLKRSTFSLVDLAGSEKWRPSLAQATTTSSSSGALSGSSGAANVTSANNIHNSLQQSVDQQLKEMNNINTSLHVLGNCVSALIEVPTRKHIPYRDSTLTRLLQDALGGNGRTILIATIHHDSVYRDESYSTLQFASRASCIKVVLNHNISMSTDATLAQAQKQIKLLRAKLQEMQQSGGSDGITGLRRAGGPCSKCDSSAKLVQSLRQQLQEILEDKDYLMRTLDEHYIPYDLGIVPHKPYVAESAMGGDGDSLKQGSLLELDIDVTQSMKGGFTAGLMSKSISSLDSDDDGSVGSLTKGSNGNRQGVKSSQSSRKKKSAAGGNGLGSSNKLQQKLKASSNTSTAASGGVAATAVSPLLVTSNTARTPSVESTEVAVQAPLKPKRVVNSEGYVVDYVPPVASTQQQDLRQSVPAMHHSVSAPNALIPATHKSAEFASPHRAKASSQLPARYESSPYLESSTAKPKVIKSKIPGEQRTVEAALEAAAYALEVDTYTGMKTKKSVSPEKSTPLTPAPPTTTVAPAQNSYAQLLNTNLTKSASSVTTGSEVSRSKERYSTEPTQLAESGYSGYTDNSSYSEPKSVAAASPVVPVAAPTSTTRVLAPVAPPAASAIGGACLKHGLDSCVLCQMFGEKTAAPVVAPAPATIAPVVSEKSNSGPSSTHYDGGASSRASAANSGKNMATSSALLQSGSNIIASSKYSSTSGTSAMTAAPAPAAVVASTTRAKSPYSASLGLNYEYPSVDDAGTAVCKTHGVTDCLLCALRAKREAAAASNVENLVDSTVGYSQTNYSSLNRIPSGQQPLAPIGQAPSSLDSADSGIIGYGFSSKGSSERRGISYGFENKERASMNGSAKDYLDMDYSNTAGAVNGGNYSSITSKPPSHNYQYNSTYQSRQTQEYGNPVPSQNDGITRNSPRINEIRSIPQVGHRYKATDDDDDDDNDDDGDNDDGSVSKYSSAQNYQQKQQQQQLQQQQQSFESNRKPRHIREMEQAGGSGGGSQSYQQSQQQGSYSMQQPSPARQSSTNTNPNLQPSPSYVSQPSPNRPYPSQLPSVQQQGAIPFPSQVQPGPSSQYTNPPPLKTVDTHYGNKSYDHVNNSLSSSMSSSMRKENHRYESYDSHAKVLESPQYASSPGPSASIPLVPVRSPPRAHQHFAGPSAQGGGKTKIHYEEDEYDMMEPQLDGGADGTGAEDDDDDEGEEEDGQPTTAAMFMQQYRAIGTNNNNPALQAAALAAMAGGHGGEGAAGGKPKKKKKVKKKTSAGGTRKQPPPPIGSAAAIQLLAAANVKKRMEKVNQLGR